MSIVEVFISLIVYIIAGNVIYYFFKFVYCECIKSSDKIQKILEENQKPDYSPKYYPIDFAHKNTLRVTLREVDTKEFVQEHLIDVVEITNKPV